MAPHPITATRTMVLSFSVVLRWLVSCALGVNFAYVISQGSCVYCFRPTIRRVSKPKFAGSRANVSRISGGAAANSALSSLT